MTRRDRLRLISAYRSSAILQRVEIMRRLYFLIIVSLGLLITLLCRAFNHPAFFAGAIVFAAVNLLLAFRRPQWALVALMFQIPLFNNMIFHEPLGSSPAALILLFSFFSGWILHRIRNKELPTSPNFLERILLIFVVAGTGSALITILRFSDFYPFVGTRFHDYPVNLLGETGSNAISWVFQTMLIFLSGPALFWAATCIVVDQRQFRRVLIGLALGLGCSITFGLFQHYGHLTWGNIDFFIVRRRINATFLDPNALGSFYMLSIPPLIGLLVVTRRIVGRLALFVLLVSTLR